MTNPSKLISRGSLRMAKAALTGVQSRTDRQLAVDLPARAERRPARAIGLTA